MATGDNEELEVKKLLKMLEIQNSRLEAHGEKIWEEVKHFSWALYLLLGAPFIVKSWVHIDNIWLKFFPKLAIVVAIIACYIIHKESKDFLYAHMTVSSIKYRLGFPDASGEKVPCNVIDYIKKIKELILDVRKLANVPIRCWFEFYFIALIIFGIIEIVIIIPHMH